MGSFPDIDELNNILRPISKKKKQVYIYYYSYGCGYGYVFTYVIYLKSFFNINCWCIFLFTSS